MQFLEGRLIVSPSDLTGFLECEHLTQQELAAARGEIARPERDDPMLDMLSRRGLEHEGKHLAGFKAKGLKTVEFPFPEGESVPDLLARAAPAFDAIVEAHAGEAVAIVAHGGPNRALLCRALGMPLSRLLALGQDYGALSVLEGSAEGWALRRLNETAML